MTRNLPAIPGGKRVTFQSWQDMSVSQRLTAIERIRIWAPDARDYLVRLDDRLRSDGPVTSGKAGVLMTGVDGLGKHSVVEHLALNHPPIATATIPSQKLIVVPPIHRPDAPSLTEAIEVAVRWKWPSRLHAGALPASQANKIFEALDTRVLIFDRAQFLCTDGRLIPETIPFLVGIMSEGRVLIVLVGPRELERRVKSRPELAGKFFKWRLKPFSLDRHWTAALEDFGAKLPFQDGCLTKDTMPLRLFIACWGKPPVLATLTIEAARVRLGKKSHDVMEMEDFHRAYSEYEPDEKNPFDRDLTPFALTDIIERGSRANLRDLTS